MSVASPPVEILAVVEDLIFLAKIQQTAQQLGLTLRTAEPARLTAAMGGPLPCAAIVDLNLRSLPAVDVVRTIKENPATAHTFVLGFVSHVQTELIEKARAAGCDLVLARSAFSQQLPQLLTKLASGQATAGGMKDAG